MDPSLVDAVERSRDGDTGAFAALVEALGPQLFRVTAALLGGDVHAANDIVQETFLAAWRSLPHLTEPAQLHGWLHRVAYHHAVTWIRRRGPGGAAFHGLEPDEARREPQIPRTWAFGVGEATADEAAPRIREALSALPPRYVAPLTLFYLEGLDIRTTAHVLGIPLTTVKMRLHRGRTLLKERLLRRAPWKRHKKRAKTRPLDAIPAGGPGSLSPPTLPPTSIESNAPPSALPASTTASDPSPDPSDASLPSHLLGLRRPAS